MLTKEKAQQIFEQVKKVSTAKDVEVTIAGGQSALTRFANNTIHQNVAEENYIVSVRPVIDGKTARATTNKLDPDGIKRVVESAETLTRVQQPDPDLLPMASAAETKHSGPSAPTRFFDSTAAVTPQDRAAAVHDMVAVAKTAKLTAAGIYSSSQSMEALLNSNGVFQYHRQTSSEISITMLGDDSSGWQKQNSPDSANLRPEHLAETAARKAEQSASPKEVAAGKYTVILEPAAVLDLVGFMFFDWGGLAILDQRSFLNNRIGTKLFGENITVYDDVNHQLQSGPAFDGEGVPRQRVTLIDKGVVQNLVYARGTAAKMKKSEHAAKVGAVRPTGHGFSLPNEMGEMPLNIVFAPAATAQQRTVDQMVGSTERGILVTRLWYIREVDPYEKILTGMTRDGTFLVEDGRIRHGVRNFRFNQSLIHLLSNVEEMGALVRASGEESFDMVVPAMKVREFNFTEVTKF